MGFWSDYDRWKTTPPEEDEVIVCQCNSCDADIYAGQEVVKYDGEYYCDKDCMLEMIDYSEEYAEADEPDYDDYYADREDF